MQGQVGMKNNSDDDDGDDIVNRIARYSSGKKILLHWNAAEL